MSRSEAMRGNIHIFMICEIVYYDIIFSRQASLNAFCRPMSQSAFTDVIVDTVKLIVPTHVAKTMTPSKGCSKLSVQAIDILNEGLKSDDFESTNSGSLDV